MIPKVIDFRVTSACNLNCPYCFGTKCKEQANMDDIVAFFAECKKNGLRYVVLTGGEPTIDKRLPEFLRILDRMGLNISLTTNGFCWDDPELTKCIFDHVHSIAISLDGATEETHDKLRGIGAYNKVLKIMDDERLNNVLFRITTVVGKMNMSDVLPILDSIPRYPNIWKLYQLSPCSSNMNYFRDNKLNDEEFERIVDETIKRYKRLPTKIVSSKTDNRDLSYWFLEPDGHIMMIQNGKETKIGDIWNIPEIDTHTAKMINNNYMLGWTT